MANFGSILNDINNLAFLAGEFNWQMTDGSYTNPNGNTVSFHVITNYGIPAAQFIEGAINTYNLISGASAADPNQGLFNTNLSATQINEDIFRKYVANRVPYANFDQLSDQGLGGQHLVMHIVFAGQMYLTAFRNIIQNLFTNSTPGLGTLLHPLYGKIANVLPIRCRSNYSYSSMNCVVVELTFLTSDITHLTANNVSDSLISEISKWFIGTENAVTSIGGTIQAAQGLSSTSLAGIL